MKLLANNKKAYFEYFILDELEAGIELKGSEVKSIKDGKVSIKEAYIQIIKGEIFIINMHVSPFLQSYDKLDPYRQRKLLLSKREIKKYYNEVKLKGVSIIPLKVYINGRGLIKLSISLAKGKKLYDKREVQKEKEAKRYIDRY